MSVEAKTTKVIAALQQLLAHAVIYPRFPMDKPQPSALEYKVK
jgi:hypothetical protein